MVLMWVGPVEVAVYCHHDEHPYLVCLEGEELLMTSHFLHLDVQKEVEVEGVLWIQPQKSMNKSF